MSFSPILFYIRLFYAFWIFPFLDNGIMRAINDMGFLIREKVNFYWAPIYELKFFNGNSISIFKKENSSIFNFV
ncbi:hypothetical protein DHD32_07630 [Arenibacter sp. TNZ]|jgi:hypothetical protein|nr:hypothetical protein [Arenibacter sp. TNZ]